MEKQLYDRMNLLSSLIKIGHNPKEGAAETYEQRLQRIYGAEGLPAAKGDPELFAHLTTWNTAKGEVRDSKVAFPVLALRGMTKAREEFAENAVANMMLLAPRELVRAYHFSKVMSKAGEVIPSGYRRLLEKGLKRYVSAREEKRGWWDKAVLSNRKAMLELYAVSHTKPSAYAQAVLFDKKYPPDSIFAKVASLKTMQPQEAAGTILQYKIPMPIAMGAVANAKDPQIAIALIEQASGNELIAHTSMLKKMGVMENPVLKSAYDAAVERAKSDKRVNVLKAGKAAEVLDEQTAERIMNIQRAQVERLGGIEGNWLVLTDRSTSQRLSIHVGRQIASLIAERVKGKVYLVFFNAMPMLVDVTGCTLDQIQKSTQHITADGATSIGCGLDYIRERGLVVNGVAVVGDGLDNTPPLYKDAYARYVKQTGIEPTTYLFKLPASAQGWQDKPLWQQGLQIETYDLGADVDYYSMGNIIKMLKTSRYSLLDEIMQTPLLTLDAVFA